jgi:hypothetical protein
VVAAAWWIRLVARAILALLAMWALAFAADRWTAFLNDYRSTFRMDVWMWLAWLGPTAGAGLLFGLAAWLPLTKVR